MNDFGLSQPVGVSVSLDMLTSESTFASVLAMASCDTAKVVTIRNNRGGNVARFDIRAAGMRRDGTSVRFAGNCDSACTLYLSLPSDQMCLVPGAKFRFHSPTARSGRTAAKAQRFLYAKYPGWVRNWIAGNGGLTRRLITMDYTYASNFIRSC